MAGVHYGFPLDQIGYEEIVVYPKY